ncbi:hypothetical protein C8R43DRAFT_1125827 [Mycena crocata]|nr:hypothetical protein C8R43DRAFT_1125827 [Mycena crocata]
MFAQTRRQILDVFLHHVLTSSNALSAAGKHPVWKDVDAGWKAFSPLQAESKFSIWGVWNGRTLEGTYVLTKPQWRCFGAVGRELELEYDKQLVALTRCVEEIGLGDSLDDDNILVHLPFQAAFGVGTIVSAAVTFTLLDELSPQAIAYQLDVSAIRAMIEPAELSD